MNFLLNMQCLKLLKTFEIQQPKLPKTQVAEELLKILKSLGCFTFT